MQYLRIYADEDGESHVEALTAAYAPVDYAPPAPPFDVSPPVGTTEYVMVRFPVGWVGAMHPTPRRQIFVVQSGAIEGTATDGTVLTLRAGDMLLMEDVTGRGHSSRVVGDDEVLGMMVHLE